VPNLFSLPLSSLGLKIGKSLFQSGSKDKKAGDEYDLLIDDEIDFVLESALPGDYEKQDEGENLTPAQKKALTIQEVRKSLPTYQYREQLLQAIEEHQVIIIVGETGSGKTTQIPQYLHEHGLTKRGKVLLFPNYSFLSFLPLLRVL